MVDETPIEFWIVGIAVTGFALTYAYRHQKVPLQFLDVDRRRLPKLFWLLAGLAAAGLASGVVGLVEELSVQGV